MTHVVLTAWDADNRYPSYKEVDTLADAEIVLGRVIIEDANAFIAERPLGDPSYWLIDPGNKTVSYLSDAFRADDLLEKWDGKMLSLDQGVNARTVEDLFDAIESGNPISQVTKDKMATRKDHRGER